MRFTQLASLAGLLVSVHAGKDKQDWGLTGTGASTLWTTTVVPTYTTYCEVSLCNSLRRLLFTALHFADLIAQSPTTWAYLNTTYTVTEATTITLRKSSDLLLSSVFDLQTNHLPACPCTVSVSTPAPFVTTESYTTSVALTTPTPATTSSGASVGVPYPSANVTTTVTPATYETSTSSTSFETETSSTSLLTTLLTSSSSSSLESTTTPSVSSTVV